MEILFSKSTMDNKYITLMFKSQHHQQVLEKNEVIVVDDVRPTEILATFERLREKVSGILGNRKYQPPITGTNEHLFMGYTLSMDEFERNICFVEQVQMAMDQQLIGGLHVSRNDLKEFQMQAGSSF